MKVSFELDICFKEEVYLTSRKSSSLLKSCPCMLSTRCAPRVRTEFNIKDILHVPDRVMAMLAFGDGKIVQDMYREQWTRICGCKKHWLDK